jgi:hypothetical protein
MKRGKGNPIPAASRRLVHEREKERCLRCGGRGYEWHHRRKRNVKDEHTHCPCNGVLLCRTCHEWAHKGEWQTRDGFRLSQFDTTPSITPVLTWHGKVTLWCNGTYQSIERPVTFPPYPR